MVKIESSTALGAFKLNGVPCQRGAFQIVVEGHRVGLRHTQRTDFYIAPIPFGEWTDSADIPFASVSALVTAMEDLFFLTGYPDGVTFSQVVDTYSELVPGLTGHLAYIRSSQGTQWLPGTLGGTYYPEGVYVYVAPNWVSSRNSISAQLQSLVDTQPTPGEKAALGGTNGVPGVANKYVTNSDPRNSNARVPLAHNHAPGDIIQDAGNRFVTDAEKATWNAKQNALGFTPENAANKGIANGYAGLDAGGKVPAAQLPSYVDDVLEFANAGAFPAVGEAGKIYIALDTNLTYRWTGTVYVEISPSPGSTDAVPEGAVNKYFTVARVLATTLTGFAVPPSAVLAAADTILQAFGKLQAQINAILLNGRFETLTLWKQLVIDPASVQAVAMAADVNNLVVNVDQMLLLFAPNGAGATQVLTGITAPAPATWKILIIINNGPDVLQLQGESALSTAANRFQIQGANEQLAINEAAILLYSPLISRWRIISTYQ